MQQWIKTQWFLIGMAVAVVLAWLFPTPGAKGGWMHPELLTKVGVALVFFLHGLALPVAALRQSSLNWKLHLCIQASVFILFPLIGLIIVGATRPFLPDDARIGFFYLCATSSTVSSSIAMTAAAQGNVPGAVFNATLSSLLGVLVTPLLMSLVISAQGETLPIGSVLLDLTRWLVLPLVAGQAMRPLLGKWASRNKRYINVVDRLTILMLVYTSFCDSVQMRIWSDHGFGLVAWTIALCLLLFTVAFLLTMNVSRWLGFNWPDRVAIIFCGSKKSLATGVPMAQLMFVGNPGLSMILLPLMLYHSLQLIIGGIIAARWGRIGVDPATVRPQRAD